MRSFTNLSFLLLNIILFIPNGAKSQNNIQHESVLQNSRNITPAIQNNSEMPILKWDTLDILFGETISLNTEYTLSKTVACRLRLNLIDSKIKIENVHYFREESERGLGIGFSLNFQHLLQQPLASSLNYAMGVDILYTRRQSKEKQYNFSSTPDVLNNFWDRLSLFIHSQFGIKLSLSEKIYLEPSILAGYAITSDVFVHLPEENTRYAINKIALQGFFFIPVIKFSLEI